NSNRLQEVREMRRLESVSLRARAISEIDHRQHAPSAPLQKHCRTTNIELSVVPAHAVRPSEAACRRPCRSMTASSSDSTERYSFDTFMRPSLANNVTARRELERTTRLDGSGRVIFQQLEWSLSSVQHISHCRLAGAQPHGRATLRTMRSPGPVPSFDAN